MPVIKTKEPPTPATPEFAGPELNVVDADRSTESDHHDTVDAWFFQCFHNSGLSEHTELFGMLRFATQCGRVLA